MKFSKQYALCGKPQSRQAGTVLVWGLVILLSLTIFGVTAARMGVTDNRIAGNEVVAMETYQTADSQLNWIRPPVDRVAPDGSLGYIKQAMTSEGRTADLSPSMPAVLSGSGINSAVSMRYNGQMSMCMPQEGYAMRVEMSQDLGGFNCYGFVVRSRANSPGTGARSNHELGLMHYLPAQNPTN